MSDYIKQSVEKELKNQVSPSDSAQFLTEELWQFSKAKKLADLESLFDNLTEGIIAFSLDLNVTDSNKAGKHINENFKTFYYDGKLYKLNELLILQEVFIKNTNSVTSIEAVSCDSFGGQHIFNICASPIFSEANVLIGACLIINDVTESQKQARQLEDLISGLTHDLKTPLIAAEINFRHLLDEHFGSITNDQDQILSLLNQNNTDALRFVKNLLAIFKYEAKVSKLLLEQVEVSELLKQATSSIQLMLEEKKISLQVAPTNFKFICDLFEIKRVIVNLLINAINFTPSGGKIELKSIKNEAGDVMFIIEDSGSGISVEELPNLFKRFWQSTKTSSSTGLGLYLSKQIVEAHGGRIWAESKFGEWTRITFVIPELVS